MGKSEKSKAEKSAAAERRDPEGFDYPDQASQMALSVSALYSACSFRGFVSVILVVANMLLAGAFMVFVLVHKDVVYLQIDHEGRPSWMSANMGAVPLHETMVKDFVYTAFISDASTVQKQIEKARGLMEPNAAAIFYEQYWKQMVESMQKDRLVMSMVINNITTKSMSADYFTVEVSAIRMYSSATKPVQQSRATLILTIKRTGTYTVRNPWGMSIEGIQYQGS